MVTEKISVQKRTRSSNACEFCRSRKTRCNGDKPTCSTCKHKGIECIYADLKPTKLEQTLSGILSSIQGMQAKLDKITATSNSIGSSNSSFGTPSEISPSSGRDSNFNQSLGLLQLPDLDEILDSLDNGFNDAFLIQEQVKANFPSYDEEQDDPLEKEEIASLRNKLSKNPVLLKEHRASSLSIDKNEYKQLKLSYLENVYNELPLVCYEKLQKFENTYESNNQLNVPSNSSAFLLMICALGSLKDSNGHKYWSSEKYLTPLDELTAEDLPPGFEYVLASHEIKSQLETFNSPEIHNPILSTLTAYYYLKTGNLTSFWDELQKSSKTLHKILKRDSKAKFGGLDKEYVDVCKRIFWVNLHLERTFAKVVTRTDGINEEKSKLFSLQKQIGIPPSCVPIKYEEGSKLSASFTDERNYYLFCFMSNLLLANQDQETSTLMEKHKDSSIEEYTYVTNKLKDNLKSWVRELPINIDWNNSENTNKHIITLKLNFYKLLHSIDFSLLKKVNNSSNQFIPLATIQQLNAVSISLMTTERNILKNFKSLGYLDASPLLCLEIIDILYALIHNSRQFKLIPIEITPDDYKNILDIIEDFRPYALHSQLLYARSESLKVLIADMEYSSNKN